MFSGYRGYVIGWINFIISLKYSRTGEILAGAQSGFTLNELIVALAITGTISASAGPSLYSFVVGSNQTTQLNALFTDLSYARSESIKRGVPTIVCKSNNGESCNRAAEWHDGWLVFADDNNNLVLDDSEEPLRVHQQSPDGIRIKYGAFRSRGRYVQYLPMGHTSTNGTFTICIGADGESAKAIITSRTGRSRVSSKTSNNKVLNCS